MTTKTKTLAAAATLVAMTIALALCNGTGMPDNIPPSNDTSHQAPTPENGKTAGATGSLSSLPERAAAPTTGRSATSGGLTVQVRYADDDSAATDVIVLVARAGTRSLFTAERLATDANGMAMFADLSPGRMAVTTNRSLGDFETVEVSAGAKTTLTIRLVGVTVTGIVVNHTGTPVAAAVVETMPPMAMRAETVAVTGAHGRFRIRALRPAFLIGARAEGLGSSDNQLVMSGDPATDLKLVLAATGGVVEGLVVGVDGVGALQPVANAVVQVGEQPEIGRTRNPPFAAVVRTDSEGRFRAIGIAVGVQSVQVRANGFAPWLGTSKVLSGQTTAVRVQLQQGATIHGIVRTADGSPVARASVSVGSYANPLLRSGTYSNADGRFVLSDLPAGRVTVKANHDQRGKGITTVTTIEAEITTCELQLSRGFELHGRVLQQDNQPVAGCNVTCSWSGSHRLTTTDSLGRFTIANCTDGMVSFRVEGLGIERLRRAGIDPRAGDVELRVRSVGKPGATITGIVLDPHGQPLTDLLVLAGRAGQSVLHRINATTGPSGRFTFSPVVPGRWYLTIVTKNHPDFGRGPIELAANATQDIGVIRLAIGGTLRATIRSGSASGVQFRARRRDGGAPGGTVKLGVGQLASTRLNPGEYDLTVSGNGTAEQTIPFVIRDNEVTRFELSLQTGVRQRFVIVVPTSATAGDAINLRVMLGEQHVRSRLAGRATNAEDKPRKTRVWLVPGDYTATVTCGKLRAVLPFTVGIEEGPALPLKLK